MPPTIFHIEIRTVSVACALLLGSCNQEPPADISLDQGWVRETVAGQRSAAAYLTITNRGAGQDRVLGASSPIAVNASLHSTTQDAGIARMRPLDKVVVPSKSALSFSPGGNHVMLTGLKQPLTPGSSIELSLRFERSGERKTALRVTSASEPPAPHSSH